MINRNKIQVSVVSFTSGTNSYGERRQTQSATRTVEMDVKIYQQSLSGDVRYNDVEYIGLTKDKNINSGNRIVINNVNYDVLYVIPSERYYQILMKKV